MKLSLLLFAILIWLSFPLSAAVYTGYMIPDDKIYIIASHMPLRPPTRHSTSLNYSKIANYYRQLNTMIVRKNPVKDAMRAIAEDRIETRRTFRGLRQFNSPTLLKLRATNPFLDIRYEISRNIPYKFIQGSAFEDIENGVGMGVNEKSPKLIAINKILLIYAESAERYAYYWNRTIAQHLRQQQKKNEVKK